VWSAWRPIRVEAPSLYGFGCRIQPEKEGALVQAYALEAGLEAALDPFGPARDMFAATVCWLSGSEAAGLAHGDMETQLAAKAVR